MYGRSNPRSNRKKQERYLALQPTRLITNALLNAISQPAPKIDTPNTEFGDHTNKRILYRQIFLLYELIRSIQV